MIQKTPSRVAYRGIDVPLTAADERAATTPLTLRQPPLPKLGKLPAKRTAEGYDAARVLTGLLRKWNSRTLDGPESAARINLTTDFTGFGSELGALSIPKGREGRCNIQPVTCTADGLVLFGMDDKRFMSAIANADGTLTEGATLMLPWATRFAPIMVTKDKTLVIGESALALLSVGADGALAQIGAELPFAGTPGGALVNRDGHAILAAGSTLASYRLTPGGALEPAHSLASEQGWVFDRPPFETEDGIIVAAQHNTQNQQLQRLCAFAAEPDGTLKQIGTRDLGAIGTLSRPNINNHFVVISGRTLTAYQVDSKGFAATGTCTLNYWPRVAPVISKSGRVAGFANSATSNMAFSVPLRADGTFGEPTYSECPGTWPETRGVITRDDVLLCIRGQTLAAHKLEADGTLPRVDAYGDPKWIRPAFTITPQGHVLATHASCLTVIGGPKPSG